MLIVAQALPFDKSYELDFIRFFAKMQINICKNPQRALSATRLFVKS
jgi:hypothetical protein